MEIKATILADSINPAGNRLTTFILEYPRFIHSEFMTHRVFSRNAASSRAIPIEKMIQKIKDNPAIPVYWGANQKGMQSGEEVDNKSDAIKTWLEARDSSVEYAKQLNDLGLHKSIVNRVLEPFMPYVIICTATEYKGFFVQRANKDAQPEIRVLAEKMLALYTANKPQKLNAGDWHLPFIKEEERSIFDVKELIKISSGRCARLSYYNFDGSSDPYADIALCDKLSSSIPGHWSPLEHPAVALNTSDRFGNFVGWKQYRKFIVNENNGDYSLSS